MGDELALRGGPHDGDTLAATGEPPLVIQYPVPGAEPRMVHWYALRGEGDARRYAYQGEQDRPYRQCPSCHWHSYFPEEPREHEMDCPGRQKWTR